MHIQPNFRAPAPANCNEPGVSHLLHTAQPAAVSLYPENAVIYAQGDAAGPLYYVEFGTVRICRMSADGRRQITAFHTAGEVFGFEVGAEHQSYAESVDGAGIRTLRVNRSGDFDSSLLKLAVRSLARTQDHLMVLGRRSANERLAALLLDLAERQGSTGLVHLPMQRNDIADYLGLTFETVSRILRCLKDSRIIRLSSVSEVEILDFEALQAMCD
ncbi:helix-turn-helix domain-containing protein [Devosia sp.]|uniref:helix-turn-helix domain-containing protein n=1 Tax=Devosia sp. TaxID=1871048 RepID=UPI003A920185